jgi:hypothetical protein
MKSTCVIEEKLWTPHQSFPDYPPDPFKSVVISDEEGKFPERIALENGRSGYFIRRSAGKGSAGLIPVGLIPFEGPEPDGKTDDAN